MHIITKKVTLLPARDPFARATELTIDLPEGLTEFGIRAATLAEGATGITIDKGDGTAPFAVTEADFPLLLNYAAPGRYVIRLSDDIAVLQVQSSATDDGFTKYRPLLTAVASNAERLLTFGGSCFFGCTNLAAVDLHDCAANLLGEMSFKGCTSLPARIDLPNIAAYEEVWDKKLPFRNCDSIREIHFSSAHEATIRAVPSFEKSPNLGASNATTFFDL